MKVITFRGELFDAKCLELLEFMLNYDIIAIIGVETGGYIVANNMYQLSKTSIPLFSIKAIRNSTKTKQKLGLSNLTRILPTSVNNYLRVAEHKIRESRFKKSEIEERNVILPDELRNFLLSNTGMVAVVDDAVDTGSSMYSVVKILRKFDGIEVVTAAITQTFAEPIIKADLKLYCNTLVRFPWSMDAKNG